MAFSYNVVLVTLASAFVINVSAFFIRIPKLVEDFLLPVLIKYLFIQTEKVFKRGK